MNKNVTPIILTVLAIGIYFSFTAAKIDELKAIKAVNAGYEEALNNSEKLIKVRDSVLKTYNNISEEDRARLDKLLPNNVDNVRLIIDANGIGARHGLALKNIKTSATNIISKDDTSTPSNSSLSRRNVEPVLSHMYDTVTLSFNVTTDYNTFIDLLKDFESSLRIMDISKITMTAGDTRNYDYGVEIKTYWLKQ